MNKPISSSQFPFEDSGYNLSSEEFIDLLENQEFLKIRDGIVQLAKDLREKYKLNLEMSFLTPDKEKIKIYESLARATMTSGEHDGQEILLKDFLFCDYEK